MHLYRNCDNYRTLDIDDSCTFYSNRQWLYSESSYDYDTVGNSVIDKEDGSEPCFKTLYGSRGEEENNWFDAFGNPLKILEDNWEDYC